MSTLVLNSEQVYVLDLVSISLLNLGKRKNEIKVFEKSLCKCNLSVSESELDVVKEAATEEEEEDVSRLIFSRTLSTLSDTSATFSDVD